MSDISKKNSLLELYLQRKTGKVTDKWHSYLVEYEKILKDYRQMPISLLEIGVQNGGSLEIWGDYFENAQLIVGCEIHQNARNLKYDNKNINVVIGDANSEGTVKNILDLSSSYDLIIDDGSHVSKDIIKSFSKYFPFLKSGGKYIIEDLHASYWSKWGGRSCFSALFNKFFKKANRCDTQGALGCFKRIFMAI